VKQIMFQNGLTSYILEMEVLSPSKCECDLYLKQLFYVKHSSDCSLVNVVVTTTILLYAKKLSEHPNTTDIDWFLTVHQLKSLWKSFCNLKYFSSLYFDFWFK
jgi:hypothetical protein